MGQDRRGAGVDVMDAEANRRLEALLRDGVRQEMGGLVEELRRFIDRRLAEVSTEINATVQLMDYSEANLSGQLARIHEQIDRVVSLPAAATRQSGLELAAIVDATETAASRIIDAAEAITGALGNGCADPAAAELVAENVKAILAACSFHDLTSQRIRHAIAHLQQVEGMLAEMMPGGVPDPVPEPLPPPEALCLSQDEIDHLFQAQPPEKRRG
jgi:chemotaxis protein CheZ